jgi:pilus assembly protein CpaB
MPAPRRHPSTTDPAVHNRALTRASAPPAGQHRAVPSLRRPRSPVHLLRQVVAAALACLALVLALRAPPSATDPAAEPTVPVAVSVTDLAAGKVLAAGDLGTVRLPAAAVPSGSATSPAQLTGQVLAAPVRSGEVVTDVRVVGPRLWSQVPDGAVAAPVRLADLAVATLLRAGDRVDVLGTAGGDGDGGGPVVEVVAEDALVLSSPAADDQQFDVGDGTGLLVLAVAPQTAQRLAAAGAAGTLTVTLGGP